MNHKQAQNSDGEGLTVQSGRDTIISNGVSKDDIREIMSTLADQLPKFAQIAAAVAEERIRVFEEKIISKFEKEIQSKFESFGDPDFQFLLQDAQKSYVRSGSEEISDQLADLIVERSKLDGRSRKGMAIKKAIEVTPSLTSEEISIISIIFSIRNVKFKIGDQIKDLGFILNSINKSFIGKIYNPDDSVMYLESIGCGSLSVASCDITSALLNSYPTNTLKYKNQSRFSIYQQAKYSNSPCQRDFLSSDMMIG